MDDPTLLYSFETINNFIYKQHNSDHHGVLMLISDRSGEMGKERTTLRADLMEIRAIQKEVRTSADKIWTQNKHKNAFGTGIQRDESLDEKKASLDGSSEGEKGFASRL